MLETIEKLGLLREDKSVEIEKIIEHEE